MRTARDIDDDMPATAKDLAGRGRPQGVLRAYGFDPVPAGGAVVTDEMVNALRDETGV